MTLLREATLSCCSAHCLSATLPTAVALSPASTMHGRPQCMRWLLISHATNSSGIAPCKHTALQTTVHALAAYLSRYQQQWHYPLQPHCIVDQYMHTEWTRR
eukprot:1157648-Pelagomonas_calceolata.AAC.3